MKKAICIIRTSTDRQHIEEQTAEVLQMAKADGFTDEDIEVIGKCGASAIKLDEAYMENLNLLYKRLESGDIDCVYAWAIDRIGRDEVTLLQLKKTLEEKKIQLKIKEPSLTLFNKIGDTLTINSGVELAFSMFATMAKQEMIHKKERFRRGKRQAGKEARYTGGTIAFGYSITENNRYIINEEEAEIVRKIYRMYLTGRYSLKSLTEELKVRGILWRDGKQFTLARVRLIMYNTCYIGVSGGAGIQQFPRIISDELYQQTRQILAQNKTSMSMESKHSYFANKLIKCPECGYSYVSNARIYRCVKQSNAKAWSAGKTDYVPCHNDVSISVEAMDGLLYKIARNTHHQFLKNDLADRKKYLSEENAELKERKSGLEKKYENYAKRKKIIYDGYADLVYTEEEYQQRLSKLNKEYESIKNEISALDERIMRNNELMMIENDEIGQTLSAHILTRGYMLGADEKGIAHLVNMYVKKITLERYTPEMQMSSLTFKIRTENAKTENYAPPKPDKQATRITVEFHDGHIEKYVYYARRKSTRFFDVKYNLEAPFPVEPMMRDSRGCYNEEMRLSAEIIRRAKDLKSRGVNLKEIVDEPHFDMRHYDDAETNKLMSMISMYGMRYKSYEYLAIIDIIASL